MQYYKIRQNGFKEIKKQMLIRILPIMLIAVTVGITISSVNSQDKAIDINILPIIIPLIAVAVGVGFYRGINRQKVLFESYQLTLTSNLITREQFNTPTVSIYFNDIKEIIKNKNGSFIVRGKDPTDLIAIPVQIDNYIELENALDQIKSITTKSSKSFLRQYSIAIVVFTLALMLCLYTVTNKIIVAFSGTLLVAILLWSIYEIRRSKNIDAKTKSSMWWVLIVLASIIGMMIMKLIGVPKT